MEASIQISTTDRKWPAHHWLIGIRYIENVDLGFLMRHPWWGTELYEKTTHFHWQIWYIYLSSQLPSPLISSQMVCFSKIIDSCWWFRTPRMAPTTTSTSNQRLRGFYVGYVCRTEVEPGMAAEWHHFPLFVDYMSNMLAIIFLKDASRYLLGTSWNIYLFNRSFTHLSFGITRQSSEKSIFQGVCWGVPIQCSKMIEMIDSQLTLDSSTMTLELGLFPSWFVTIARR